MQNPPTTHAVTTSHYPHGLVGEITTTTGRRLRVRPIRSSDAPGLVAFHNQLSDSSVYRRYFSWHSELTNTEVAHLTTVDYVDRLALVVEDDGTLVAVGRYDRFPDTDRAEVAFLVTDSLQRCGVGHQLLERLAEAAYECGITTFVAETQSDNLGMLGVFAHSRFAQQRSVADGVAYVRLSIVPGDRTVDA